MYRNTFKTYLICGNGDNFYNVINIRKIDKIVNSTIPRFSKCLYNQRFIADSDRMFYKPLSKVLTALLTTITKTLQEVVLINIGYLRAPKT